ncbi:hypothetical protein D3C76_1730510 [compost metagenome]
MLTVQQVLGLLAVHAVQVDARKTAHIFLKVLGHHLDVTLNIRVTLAGQLRDLAGRHRARHRSVVRILWRGP